VYTEFIKQINVALDLDSKRSSHPVQLHAESPGEIGQVRTSFDLPFLATDTESPQAFDQLSYCKAASGELQPYNFTFSKIDHFCHRTPVLRMLVNCVGEETFLKGVSIYLKQHLYGNATAEDLWEGISSAAGRRKAR
jgi:aminopeptidase 2